MLAKCDACKAHDPLAQCKCKNKEYHNFRINFRDIPECNCEKEAKYYNVHS
jgi:hypothetical protein